MSIPAVIWFLFVGAVLGAILVRLHEAQGTIGGFRWTSLN